jgi:hypothetical protein
MDKNRNQIKREVERKKTERIITRDPLGLTT